MKLLVGRLLLGCLLAVLVLGDDPVTDNVETVKTPAEVVPAVEAVPAVVVVPTPTATVVVTTAPEPLKTKIFSSEQKSPTVETYSKPQVYFPQPSNDGHHHHHDFDDFDDHDHHHHHHQAPVPRPPPSSHHHHQPSYPGYYPQQYYPAPYPYSAPVYAPVPPMPYPYYPQHQAPQQPGYYPKPVTVIQTVPANSGNTGSSSGGQNFVKPGELIHQSTGYLWNLIDQKNTELWNLFGNKQGSNNGDKGDSDTIHEVVVTYQDPPSGTHVRPGKPSYSTGNNNNNNNGGGNWFIKGKSAPETNCKHDHPETK